RPHQGRLGPLRHPGHPGHRAGAWRQPAAPLTGPPSNMWSRRLIVFGLFLACLIGALVTGRDLFYNLVYLWIAVIVIAGVWTWTAITRIRIGRHPRALRAQVGRPLEERLAVRNDSAIPKLWLEVRDHSDLPGHEASLVVDSLAPHRERVWVVRSLCR